MRKAVLKLIIAITSVPAGMLLTGVTQNGFFMLVSLVGFVLSILWAMDLKRQLDAQPEPDTGQRITLAMLAVPQAIIGLTALVIGLAMIGWLLFNLFIARQPQFTFNWMALPIPFALVVVGGNWLKGVFRRG